jgi:signal transduction histidine kinase
LGLYSAIRWFARSNLEKSGVKVEFWTASESMRLPPHLETMLFRIAQEAISNIVHHARANRVGIRLWEAEQQFWLEIKDDGCGFEMEETTGGGFDREHLGLLGIQERVSLAGGEVTITSAPGLGTCLQLHVPLPAEHPPEHAAQGTSDHPEGIVQP